MTAALWFFPAVRLLIRNVARTSVVGIRNLNGEADRQARLLPVSDIAEITLAHSAFWLFG